jgi:hypothetical protein
MSLIDVHYNSTLYFHCYICNNEMSLSFPFGIQLSRVNYFIEYLQRFPRKVVINFADKLADSGQGVSFLGRTVEYAMYPFRRVLFNSSFTAVLTVFTVYCI